MEQYQNNNSVRFALLSMGFEPYTHIVVRTRKDGHIDTLGGSLNLSTILSRYGNMTVEKSCIVDNVLYVDVNSD